jgi:hypothetical protein
MLRNLIRIADIKTVLSRELVQVFSWFESSQKLTIDPSQRQPPVLDAETVASEASTLEQWVMRR